MERPLLALSRLRQDLSEPLEFLVDSTWLCLAWALRELVGMQAEQIMTPPDGVSIDYADRVETGVNP